jgi:pyruvate dehydrogenase phosphatase
MPGEKKQNADGATYTVLTEHDLAAELTRHAQAQTIGTTDVVSIQPCPTPAERSQDRFVVADWLISDQTWRFQAVLDGHAGHETVDHVVTILPDIVRNALVAAFATEGKLDVRELLRKAIADLDEQISQEMLDLFPGGPVALANISDEEVAFLINDGGVNSVKILRCMRGCTVLVALVGPDLDIWVASLGDSQCGK